MKPKRAPFIAGLLAVMSCSEVTTPEAESWPTDFFAEGHVLAEGQPVSWAKVGPLQSWINGPFSYTDTLGYYQMEFSSDFCSVRINSPALGLSIWPPQNVRTWWLDLRAEHRTATGQVVGVVQRWVWHPPDPPRDTEFCVNPRQRVDFIFSRPCQRLDCNSDGRLDGCGCHKACVGAFGGGC